jgi:UDP-N-acetylmuramoyl-tripeptide--D-alanyl-D-alanine ligase
MTDANRPPRSAAPEQGRAPSGGREPYSANGGPMMRLADASAMVPGSALVGDGARAFERVHTDTRTLRAGDLFVALKGERFDAHEFLPQARAAGAVAAIATHGVAEAGLDGLVVPDSLLALQQLATGWRARFEAPVIAVTGSNGKTTVTQMIASILRAAHGEAAHATAGNLNNHIGVPLTVLQLRAAHRAAVVELGMNHPGEIAVLAAIAQPTVGLVNNAQREHQEFMGTVEAVARENGAALEALPADGVAVFPADDEYAAIWLAQAGRRRCLRFALANERVTDDSWPECEIAAVAKWDTDHWKVDVRTPSGSAQFVLRIAGRHNVLNALAATAATLGAGVALPDVVRGLEAFAPVKGRSQLKSLRRGGRTLPLVDDTYNANPDSVRAAIDVLAGLPAPRWLLLGDMGEVGDQGPAFHQEIGAYTKGRGIDHFWCAGALCAHAAKAYGAGARHFADTPALLAALGDSAAAAEPAFGAVLAKGSRFMGMERVVALLIAHDDNDNDKGADHAA